MRHSISFAPTPLRYFRFGIPSNFSNKGTGNVLFQLSSTLGIARAFGVEPNFIGLQTYASILSKHYRCKHASTIYRNFQEAEPLERAAKFSEFEGCHKQPDPNLYSFVEKSVKNQNILLDGYFEWPPYFKDILPEVLSRLRPDRRSKELILDKIPAISKKNSVSIHLRNGSLANYEPHFNYHLKAIRFISSLHSNAYFIIFSERDISELELSVPHTFVSYDSEYRRDEDYLDIWAMSLCSHNVTGYSTFSWWGALMNENPYKICTYPNSALNFITNDDKMGNLLHRDSIHDNYFLRWINVDDE